MTRRRLVLRSGCARFPLTPLHCQLAAAILVRPEHDALRRRLDAYAACSPPYAGDTDADTLRRENAAAQTLVCAYLAAA